MLDAPRQSAGDLLQHPTVAIGIFKLRTRAISATLRIQPRRWPVLAEVKEFGYLDTRGNHRIACGYDIGNGDVSLPRTGRGRSQVCAELQRTHRAMRCDLDYAEIGEVEVCVKSPSQFQVKLLRAIDICNGKDGDLDLLIYSCDVCSAGVTTIDLFCQ